MSDPLPSDIEEALSAESKRLGVFADHFNYFSVVPSTNDVALRLAEDGAQDGTIVLAAAQTAGRGRRGREWFSPVGGLYFSVIMRGLQSPTVTLMAGVGDHVPANSSTWKFSPIGKFAGWARNCAVAGTAEFKNVASTRGAPTRGCGGAKVIGRKFVLSIQNKP